MLIERSNHNMDPAIIGTNQFGPLWRTKLLGNYKYGTIKSASEQVYAQPLVYTPPGPGSVQYVYLATTMNWASLLRVDLAIFWLIEK